MSDDQRPSPLPLDYAPSRKRSWRWLRWVLSGLVVALIVIPIMLLLMNVHVERQKQRALRAQRAAAFRAIGQAMLLYVGTKESMDPCLLNFGAIQRALHLYAESHGGNFPSDLRTLLNSEEAQLDAQRLRCWAIGTGSASYTYCGAGLTNSAPPDAVLAYEPLANHGGAGTWAV